MVNPALVAAAASLSPRRILVTGGTGFVGSHLARALAAGGHDVVACGRNPYRVPFPPEGPRFARVELTDPTRLREMIADSDLVYHCAALAAPWGAQSDFERANMDGTRHVVDACLESQIPRLVHVSSTALQFDFQDQLNVREEEPLANPFACHYAWSKAEAEAIVRNGHQQGLNAVIVRARALFGEGDNSLLPRFLRAADQGRLRVIGSRDTRIDLTHIDNLVLALIQAAERGQPGRTYTVTNDDPVKLWPFLEEILRQTGRTVALKSIPRSWALRAAGLLEFWHRIRQLPGEPALTKYTVGLLSTTKTFDISAAKRDLGYCPIVSMDQGARQVVLASQRKDDSHASTSVRLKLMTTGYTTAHASLAESQTQLSGTIRFHATIGLIDHPVHGLTLFDTGYSPRFFEATQPWSYRLYRYTTPVFTDPRLSAAEMLRREGIDPLDVRRIILSHFHADHTCGLIDFPHADIIALQRCWDDVRRRRGLSALRRAYLPSLIPKSVERRLCLIEHFHDPGFGPFARSHDLFADGSVRLLELSGHAIGQMGVLLQRGPDDRAFLVADSAWTTRTIRENLPLTWPFRLLAASPKEARETVQTLHEFSRQYPDIELIPSHCPEVAKRYQLDAMLESVVGLNGRQPQ